MTDKNPTDGEVTEIIEWWKRTKPMREHMAAAIARHPVEEHARLIEDLNAGVLAWVITVNRAELVRFETDTRTAAEILDEPGGMYL